MRWDSVLGAEPSRRRSCIGEAARGEQDQGPGAPALPGPGGDREQRGGDGAPGVPGAVSLTCLLSFTASMVFE